MKRQGQKGNISKLGHAVDETPITRDSFLFGGIFLSINFRFNYIIQNLKKSYNLYSVGGSLNLKHIVHCRPSHNCFLKQTKVGQ
jgi:hypothetical protein